MRLCLLEIWGDQDIQKQFEGSTQNKKIFEDISARLAERNVVQSADQCHEKIKKLHGEYKNIRGHNISGRNRKTILSPATGRHTVRRLRTTLLASSVRRREWPAAKYPQKQKHYQFKSHLYSFYTIDIMVLPRGFWHQSALCLTGWLHNTSYTFILARYA